MKKLFSFSGAMAVVVIMSAATFSSSVQNTSTANELEEIKMSCFTIDACGQEAQWCDAGYHPPLDEYIEALMDHFC